MMQFQLQKQSKSLLKALSFIIIMMSTLYAVNAQKLVTSVEAESGTRAGGLTIGTSNLGYSGSGYVTNMANTGVDLSFL